MTGRPVVRWVHTMEGPLESKEGPCGREAEAMRLWEGPHLSSCTHW